MTVFTEVAAAVLAALLRGGKLARLAALDLRGVPLLFLTVSLRLLADWLATYRLPAAVWLQPVAYLALGWFFILNIRRAGFLPLGAGSALNLLVMLFNGGAMPVSPDALEAIGAATVPQGTHTLLTGSTRLPFLADVIPLRWHFPGPVVISAGDILITLGVFLFIQRQMLAPQTGSPESRW
ncbi:MAG: hypothetical protein DDT21_01492 [Syntrophomonadaceae bacterium]|nr:hypothetical protein [Bacillota bacterium]